MNGDDMNQYFKDITRKGIFDWEYFFQNFENRYSKDLLYTRSLENSLEASDYYSCIVAGFNGDPKLENRQYIVAKLVEYAYNQDDWFLKLSRYNLKDLLYQYSKCEDYTSSTQDVIRNYYIQLLAKPDFFTFKDPDIDYIIAIADMKDMIPHLKQKIRLDDSLHRSKRVERKVTKGAMNTEYALARLGDKESIDKVIGFFSDYETIYKRTGSFKMYDNLDFVRQPEVIELYIKMLNARDVKLSNSPNSDSRLPSLSRIAAGHLGKLLADWPHEALMKMSDPDEQYQCVMDWIRDQKGVYRFK